MRETDPQGGAVFEFVLSLPSADRYEDKTKNKPQAPLQPVHISGGLFRILVVDDAELNRLVIQEYLEGTHCQLHFANDGVQALEAFKSGQFDIVLMDKKMAQLDGLNATRQIRAWEHANGRSATPILIITADLPHGARDIVINAGANDLLHKPLSRTELYAALEQHLQTGDPHRF